MHLAVCEAYTLIHSQFNETLFIFKVLNTYVYISCIMYIPNIIEKMKNRFSETITNTINFSLLSFSIFS